MAASRLFTREGWGGNTVTMTTGSFPCHWLLLHIIYHRLILGRLVISADSGLNMPNGWPLKSPMFFATSDASTSSRFRGLIFKDSSFQKLTLTSSNNWVHNISSRWVCLRNAIIFFLNLYWTISEWHLDIFTSPYIGRQIKFWSSLQFWHEKIKINSMEKKCVLFCNKTLESFRSIGSR